MRAFLSDAFPDHGLLGEEYGLERENAPYRWVLDPIDGTRAFITGRPAFGTLLALLHEGRPILGMIDQPITRERWLGVADHPTRFEGPFGGRPGVRPCPTVAKAELSCTSPEMLGDDLPRWRNLGSRVRRLSWGGDCYAYGLLALGCIDIVAECDLKIWDWAALLPVIEGAGGRMTDWDGASLHAGGDGRVLAVGDPRLLDQATDLLSR